MYSVKHTLGESRRELDDDSQKVKMDQHSTAMKQGILDLKKYKPTANWWYILMYNVLLRKLLLQV